MSTQLLTLCSRINFTEENYQQLLEFSKQVEIWDDIPLLAEQQGLAPLVCRYLKDGKIEHPNNVRRELQALYLRHKHANRILTESLHEILSAFQQAGIRAILLKGMALSYLLYPEPNLRPKRDMDILVKKSEAKQAQQILANLGFDAPLPNNELYSDKHLPIADRQSQGMTVSVEIHHNLFDAYYPISMTFDDLTVPQISFPIDGTTAYTLGYEDMLWHLCQHVAYHANVWEPIRLIWVADIVGIAEKFALDIDWTHITKEYPLILNMLSLFHCFTPLSAQLLSAAPIKVGPKPQGIGEEFSGWPRVPFKPQENKGYKPILRATLFPSEWWLRLHYGLDTTQYLFLYRLIKHPLYIFAIASWRSVFAKLWYRWQIHPLKLVGRLKQSVK
ncbi:MAG: hypothetical protein B6242_06000 [Anaerolineaceae bacterium 4572_78]|nr:MAG: hypothetical protein B6242_06000 [Anaerolineaceae bacterium 4572_78]